MGNPRHRELSLVVYQQNVRGLGEAKIEELVWQMKRLNVYAWTLQETWRSGREILRNGDLNTDAGDDDFIILTNGLDSPVCHRGAQGVALVLGPADADVDKRIKSASAAFGALRDCVFANRDLSPQVKGRVYVALVLTILLYNSEIWYLR